jgi:hypothetical protein
VGLFVSVRGVAIDDGALAYSLISQEYDADLFTISVSIRGRDTHII